MSPPVVTSLPRLHTCGALCLILGALLLPRGVASTPYELRPGGLGVAAALNLTSPDPDSIPHGAASLAFVFDITGSMYDDLVQVIEGAAKILATTLARRDKPLYNYVLVPFHDPGELLHTSLYVIICARPSVYEYLCLASFHDPGESQNIIASV